MIDLTLAGGEVFDGTGGAAFRADVGIRDGRIACIGDLSGQESAERVELNGLAVCPGFIDLHTHSDFTLLVNGRAESQVHQGVTTEVVGQCGHSCAPVARAGDARHGAIGYSDDCKVDMGWQSFGEYLERLDASRPGVNVAAFVGHGAVHRAVMGDELRAPAVEETQRMADLLAEAFDRNPRHPYTRALLSAVPARRGPRKSERIRLEGDIPSPVNVPRGCRFHTRCAHAQARCRVEVPALVEKEPGHWEACHFDTSPHRRSVAHRT